jgi:hypothetical protein
MSIGGLISYFMDTDCSFSSFSSSLSSRETTPSVLSIPERQYQTNLSKENFAWELDFKLKVLDWLNNGKPKLYRSPAEGTYLVCLMNVSLKPEVALGRMLHSFTATAYEVGSADLQTLKKLNFLGGK